MEVYTIFFHLWILLCTSQTSLACNIQAAETSCLNYNEITSELSIYTSVEQLESKCSILQPALECCLGDRYAKGCNPLKTLKFRIQRNVIESVCGRWKEESQRAVSCMRTVKPALDLCMSKVLRARTNVCRVTDETFSCATAVAKDAEGCDNTAKWLIQRIVHLYLEPIASTFNCEWNPKFIFRSLGIVGRTCNKSSTGTDGCDIMCGGRGYHTRMVQRHQKCECKFVWCCAVRCKTCMQWVEHHTCKGPTPTIGISVHDTCDTKWQQENKGQSAT